MGKKEKREKVDKREQFAQKRAKEKTRNKIIAAGVAAFVIGVVGYSIYIFTGTNFAGPDAPPNAGALGDEHVHAAMKVIIHGDHFDFSSSAFQIQNRYIHFENQNPHTIHRHASNVSLGFLFDTLDIDVTEECFVFPQDRKEFCTNDKYTLKFFINGDRVQSISDYVIEGDDRILISYGNQTQAEIQDQLKLVDSLTLDK